MAKALSPNGSQAFAQRVFEAKERWHRKQAKLSLVQKLRALDRMREMASLMRSGVPVTEEPPEDISAPATQ